MSLWQVFSSIIIRHPVLCSSYFMCVQIKKQNYLYLKVKNFTLRLSFRKEKVKRVQSVKNSKDEDEMRMRMK